jgi:hypothetical protein
MEGEELLHNDLRELESESSISQLGDPLLQPRRLLHGLIVAILMPCGTALWQTTKFKLSEAHGPFTQAESTGWSDQCSTLPGAIAMAGA